MSEEDRSTSTPKRRIKRSSGEESQESVGVSDAKTSSEEKKEFNSFGLSYRFVRIFAWVVLVTWGIGFTVDMSGLRKDWDMPAGSWALMTLVAGGTFVAQAIKERNE